MTRKIRAILAGFALAAATLAPCAVQATDTRQDEQAISQIEMQWCAGIVKADAAAIGALLSEDFTDVTMDGSVENKAQALADLKIDKTTVCDTDELKVRVHGDSAIAVGRTKWVTPKYNMYYRFTDSYVRRDGHWLAVASQSTQITKK